MGLIRLRVRELAQEKGWNLTEVSKRTGIPYTTIITYANSPGMARSGKKRSPLISKVGGQLLYLSLLLQDQDLASV